MSPRRRGDTEDVVEDYHDTGRPEHRKSRHVGILAKDDVTAEEQILSFSNESPINGQESAMSNSTSPQPPAGWSPELDADGSILYWDGPSATVQDAALFTDWTPGQGVSIRDSNGHTIPLEDLVPFACQVLRVHSAVLAARREVAL